MSEYWVSKKKYYCQYCEIYIADDAPSRSQHENGLRHKGNKDRFIRGLYKAGVKKRQESEEEKREMKRVEEAAQAAYARDVGAGLVTPGASSSSAPAPPAAKPKAPPPKPSDPYTNYTTAASLGFTDPDVERLVAEAEVRKNEGRAGDWVAVVPPPPLPQDSTAPAAGGVKSEHEHSTGEVRKRVEEPAAVDEDDTRQFKMRKRTVAVGLGEIYDPGIIRVKPRTDPNIKGESEPISLSNSMPVPGPTLGDNLLQSDAKSLVASIGPKATEKPSWTRREWKWAGENEAEGANSAVAQADGAHLDAEQGTGLASRDAMPDSTHPKESIDEPRIEPSSDVKKEDLQDSELLSGVSSGRGLFRKRKARGDSSARGRREE